MEYRPHYAQPFTLREAVELDIEVINEEIARLQNSLSKLNDTQAHLREYIEESKAESGEADADVVEAFEENVDVIGAQEERIYILKLALSEKGIDISSKHYDAPKPKSEQRLNVASVVSSPEGDMGEHSSAGGVYL